MQDLCLEEISRIVLDENSKVSVGLLSDEHGISFKESSDLMEKWIAQYDGKRELLCEYLIRGVDKEGSSVITVLPSETLKELESNYVQLAKWMYTIQPTTNSEILKIPDFEKEIKFKTLEIASEKRDPDSLIILPSNEEKPTLISGQIKLKAETSDVAKKEEPSSSSKSKTLQSMFANSSSKVKEEKTSPESEEKKVTKSPPPSKKDPSPKKNSKKPTTKGSIASFFKNTQSSKPKPSSTPLPSTNNQEEDTHTPIKEHPIEVEKPDSPHKDEKKNRKRTISDESDDDEVVPGTPQERTSKLHKPKKPVMKAVKRKGNPNKKSRLMQIVDSSESEDERREEETEEKCINFDSDVEMEEKEGKKESSPNENDASNVNKTKAKIRKEVTKTFVDEEGYLTTLKEYEMVDVSDEEEEQKKKNEDKSQPKEEVKELKKTISPPTPKTKQGSIMSFFSKK